jgi:hypothetical protein
MFLFFTSYCLFIPFLLMPFSSYGARNIGTIKHSITPFIPHFLWKDNSCVKDKNVISISPAGFKGFYVSGIVSFIKEHYSLDCFVFSGASAGAWNALFFTFKRDPYELLIPILESKEIRESKSIRDIENYMKQWILSRYTEDDFDLERLFVGITVLQGLKIKTNIVTDFDNLEDALNACIASSHIPFVTGGLLNKYNNLYSFDGGFSRNPYLHTSQSVLHITPSLWKETVTNKYVNLKDLLLRKNNSDLMKLFDNGYNDAKKNKPFLDSIFVRSSE